MPYYAHIRQDENGETFYQTVAEHLTGTAALCREFAADFGAEADGDLMGLAHDLGKCTDAFQKRLLEGGPVVDHTTAGMLTCIRMKRPSAAACVAGHHGGLLDVGNLRTDRAGEATLSGRFKKGVEGHYLERCGESGVTLPTLPPETPERDPLKASFRTRMLYSCLVDADFLDTERFMDGERGRGGYDDLPTLLRRLKEYIAPWQNPKTALNKLRCKILNSCLDTGSKPKGIYTLTVPTGGGKTVASLAFALRHAVAHGMKRVIYVVPYTSIIEQNAEVFREILGDGNVLEHHSGVQFELSDGASPEEVYRELAGLDSVLQAAGRCNREGKRAPEESIVTVFERAELPPMLFRTAIGATREALMNSCDIGARETMQNYFDALRSLSGETLDKSGVIKAFEKGINGCELPFRTVAENFHLIDQNTRTVYVPFGGGAALVEQLKEGECSKGLYRKLGRYAVSVYEPHFQKLYAAGALLTAREVPALDEDSSILNDMSLYSEMTGLTLEPETGKAEFI